MELSLLGAFLGGVLTLLSPCSVMLLPAFFAYAFTSPGALVTRTGVFFAGLATTLVPLGMIAGSLGAWVSQFRFELVTGASIIVILLGLAMVTGLRIPGLIQQRGSGSSSVFSVFALGTIYGLAGVCAGPALGAALAFAAFGGNPVAGGLVLLVFAAGMVVPLVILALLWNVLPGVRTLVRPREIRIGRWRNTWSSVVGGALTAGIGVLLLLTHGTTSLGGVLGATDQARLESGMIQWTAQVPEWITVTIFIAVAGVGVAVALLRRRRRRSLQHTTDAHTLVNTATRN